MDLCLLDGRGGDVVLIHCVVDLVLFVVEAVVDALLDHTRQVFTVLHTRAFVAEHLRECLTRVDRRAVVGLW